MIRLPKTNAKQMPSVNRNSVENAFLLTEWGIAVLKYVTISFSFENKIPSIKHKRERLQLKQWVQ